VPRATLCAHVCAHPSRCPPLLLQRACQASAAGKPLEALETLAGQWIAEHPEYHADLADADAAVAREYDAGEGRQTNPFLHLSMHLSISEQCSIDQPRGIRQAVELLAPAAIRCTTPTTKPWSAWARCSGKASAPAGRRTARRMLLDAVQRRATQGLNRFRKTYKNPPEAGFVLLRGRSARSNGNAFQAPS
jgi:hypothetical protein